LVSREPLHTDDPDAISSYRLLARLGEGGMGVVYLAETPEGRQVAVKVIRQHLAIHDDFRARFRAEVATASKVARFCTAPILDADTTADPPYIVTEYIDGPTLGSVVDEHGALPGAQLHALGVGVASALGAIHHAGVVHRDLKPSNVLLSRFGPQVIDFGIARAVDAVTSITQPGRMMGSPSYMAPEQFRSDKLTQKVDIFAWGAVMVFAGTGHQPFGASTDAVFYQVLYGEPDLRGLDSQIAELVSWALRKEPEQRPTAQQLLDALVRGRGPGADTWPGEAETSGPVGARPERRAGERRSGVRTGPGEQSGSGEYPDYGAGDRRQPVEALMSVRQASSEASAATSYGPPPPPPAPPPPAAPAGPTVKLAGDDVSTAGEPRSPTRRHSRGSRHSGPPPSRHAPDRRRRPIVKWIVVGIIGGLVGAGASFAAVSYLDYRDARAGATSAVAAYLTDIHNENYPSAFARLCPSVQQVDGPDGFTRSLQSKPGIESFVVQKSVPLRLTSPYPVTVRITEKNGNQHSSVFDVEKRTVGGRDYYLVCEVEKG
jgi:serine/threonine protein kinase